MKLTIAFITGREDPELPWIIESLTPQLRQDDRIRLLVVDALDRTSHDLNLDGLPFVNWRIVQPKPNVWQGPHRIAPRDFFANANARNTAICYCTTDYIVFMDDRSRVEPGWLDVIREGERSRASVLCGPYDKKVDSRFETTLGSGLSIDHRRQHKPAGLLDCPGGWLFGGNVALPLEWLLEVNGFEEGCDPTGQEDCVLGLMLQNRGRRIDFVTEMSVQQDRTTDVHPPGFPRLDKGVPPKDRSNELIRIFGVRKETEFTPDLRTLRTAVLERGEYAFPIPDPSVRWMDWYDGSLVKDTTL